MTSTFRFAVRPAPPGAAALLAALLLASPAILAGCGPEPAEIDRSPVAGMTEENPESGDLEDGALDAGSRNAGQLVLTGGVAYDGSASVECGPAPPRTGGHPAEDGEVAIGRVEPHGGEEPVARDDGGDDAHGEPEERFDVTLTAAGTTGLAATLHLPPEGETVRVPVLVATIAADGSYRESAGTAVVHVEKGSMVTRSAATEHVSGTFTGSYRGEAGEGEIEGRFTKCYFFN